jgi:hypothetical protein
MSLIKIRVKYIIGAFDLPFYQKVTWVLKSDKIGTPALQVHQQFDTFVYLLSKKVTQFLLRV